MVKQENLHTMLNLIVPRVLQLIMDNRSVDEKSAASLLYESELYGALETEDTKLWHLSPLALYDILEQELSTGRITWPEEQ
jgi:hypothetical protein